MKVQSPALRASVALVSALIIGTGTSSQAAPGPAPLTRARLEALKSSANDPSGDAFIGSKENLNALVDAFVADNSLASPTFLYLAANTALRLGRVEDSAFLFYGAQLRKAFDFKRYDIAREGNGNNSATYLAFLNQTIGPSVNPAIMAEPKLFASAIRRIEAWEIVPSAQAYYPDFKEARGFMLKAAEWPAAARVLKDDFLTRFGRRYTRLLTDPLYFEAFQFVQGVNLGRIDAEGPKNRARLTEMTERMKAIERKVDGVSATSPPTSVSASTPTAAATATQGKWTREQAIHELASFGYTVTARGSNKPIDGSSLVMAANEGYTDVVELLLAAGVPVDATLGATRETALFVSVRSGYLDLAATLLKAGADAKVKDENGDAPLIHLAKYCDELDLVRTFIKLGADVNAATRAGWTPLKEAESQHCPGIAKELRKAGATK